MSEVVVFQMGKVASSAIISALRRKRIKAVQAHMASPERLSRKLHQMAGAGVSDEVADEMYRGFQQELLAMHLIARRRLGQQPSSPPLRVITPVRDPLDWYWSHFAQMYPHYSQQLRRYFRSSGGSEGAFEPDKVYLQLLEQLFELMSDCSLALDDPAALPSMVEAARTIDSSQVLAAQADRFLLPLRWFGEDFLPATGIDVFTHEFSAHAGYVRIDSPAFSLLVLNYERLNELRGHLAALVGKSRLRLPKKNVGQDKDIPEGIRAIHARGQALMPESLVSRVYASRYAQHFGYGGPHMQNSTAGPG